MWIYRDEGSSTCPKPEVGAQSAYWLELFALWKWASAVDLETWPARDVEAMALLEDWIKEDQANGDRRSARGR